MSKRSLLLSSFAVFSTLPLVLGIAAWQFPLNAAPQEVYDGPAVEVKSGDFKILHRTPVAYPGSANGASGSVVVSVSVNSQGEVADAKVVSSQGPAEFRKAALSSVLNWHFATDPRLPPAFEITIAFDGTKAYTPGSIPAFQSTAVAKQGLTVAKFDVSALPQALQDQVVAARVIREGDVVALNDMENSLRTIDTHLRLSTIVKADQSAMLYVTLAAEPSAPAASVTRDRIRVGGNVQSANLIEKVTPMYPPAAKEARVQGTVRMNVIIGKDGHMLQIQLVSGDPLLVQSATEAVQKWVYRPTLLNGEPVEVMTQVDVNYTLTK